MKPLTHLCSDHCGEGPSVLDLPVPDSLKAEWATLASRRQFLTRAGKSLAWASLASLFARGNSSHASAPQAILLAVPPDLSKAWTPWMLHRLLLETMELASLRAVDAEALDRAFVDPVGAGGGGVGEVAHFLPALCFAVNAEGDAVAPNLFSLN